MRKTKKFYRESIAAQMLATPVELLKEVALKYSPKDKWHTEIYLPDDAVPFNWNHRLERIGFGKESKRLYFDVYWQGDSTDGNTTVGVEDVVRAVRWGREYVIPAENEWLGNRTYCRHGDLRIEKEEVENAYKYLVKFLSPEKKK